MSILEGFIANLTFFLCSLLVKTRILKKGILAGTWCTCWQTDSDCYETGTVDIKHIGQILNGTFYHQDKKWKFTGTCYSKSKKAKATFYHNNGSEGEIKIEYSTTPSKWSGTWSGLVTTEDNNQIETTLNIKLAKDECVHPCHVRSISSTQKTSCWK